MYGRGSKKNSYLWRNLKDCSIKCQFNHNKIRPNIIPKIIHTKIKYITLIHLDFY